MLSRDAIEWTAIAGVGATGMYNAFIPTPFELRHEVTIGDEKDVRARLVDVRKGYISAGALSVGLGLFSAFAGRSIIPFLTSIGVSAAMVSIYESAVPAQYRLGSGAMKALGDPNVIDAQYRVVS